MMGRAPVVDVARCYPWTLRYVAAVVTVILILLVAHLV